MADLNIGQLYSISEVFEIADFDLNEQAAAEYSPDGVDRRRVKVGGLGFDDVEEVFRVAGDTVEITLDGEVVATLSAE
jgi:hypothetical protein